MTRNIFLVHQNPDFAADFCEGFVKNGTEITTLKANATSPQKADLHNAVVVINADKDWDDALKSLDVLRQEGVPFYAIVSNATLLQKTVSQIDSTSERLAMNGSESSQNLREIHKKEEAPSFTDLLEKHLSDFVSKVSASKGSNVYDLLMQEVEKPLIRLALRETNGNQVQASQLLGMHRNTLRKKIKTLKIVSEKK